MENMCVCVFWHVCISCTTLRCSFVFVRVCAQMKCLRKNKWQSPHSGRDTKKHSNEQKLNNKCGASVGTNFLGIWKGYEVFCFWQLEWGLVFGDDFIRKGHKRTETTRRRLVNAMERNSSCWVWIQDIRSGNSREFPFPNSTLGKFVVVWTVLSRHWHNGWWTIIHEIFQTTNQNKMKRVSNFVRVGVFWRVLQLLWELSVVVREQLRKVIVVCAGIFRSVRSDDQMRAAKKCFGIVSQRILWSWRHALPIVVVP